MHQQSENHLSLNCWLTLFNILISQEQQSCQNHEALGQQCQEHIFLMYHGQENQTHYHTHIQADYKSEGHFNIIFLQNVIKQSTDLGKNEK